MHNWPGLLEFVRVVDTGSFSAAAGQLGVSKAHVSKQVRRLEDRLGVRLLQRTTRKLKLTDVGEAYYARSAQIVAELEETEAAIRELQEVPRGPLVISLPPVIGERYIAPLIADFAAQYPEVTIELSFTTRLVDLVEEGYDLAIRLTSSPAEGLVARKIASARLSVCGSPRYFECFGKPRSPSELKRHNCLVFAHHGNHQSGAWVFHDRGRNRKIEVKVGGSWRSDNSEGLLAATRRGMGLVYLADFFTSEDLEHGTLVRALEEWTTHETALWVVYSHRRHLSIKIRRFVDFLADRFTAASQPARLSSRRASGPTGDIVTVEPSDA